MVGSLLWEMRGFLSPRVLFDTVTLPRESAAEQPLHRFVTRMSSNYIRWCTPRNLRRQLYESNPRERGKRTGK